MSFEDRLRIWLDRRWRTRSTPVEITEADVRTALLMEREQIAAAQAKVIERLAILSRAERDDGWERADLLKLHLQVKSPDEH